MKKGLIQFFAWLQRSKKNRIVLSVLAACCVMACTVAFVLFSNIQKSQNRNEYKKTHDTEQTTMQAEQEQREALQGAGNAPVGGALADSNDGSINVEYTGNSSASALSVNGTRLVNAKGDTVMLNGASTHGLAWFPDYVNEGAFATLRSWGANCVRLAMYTAEYGGYCAGGDRENLKSLLDKGVSAATENGMYVIIDWHILSDGNPNTHIEDAKDFFAEITKKYADYTNILYEICNEPNGGTSWSQVKSYAEEIIPIIRANTDAVIIVGTPNWCQYVGDAADDPITGYDNLMYALHFYAATHTDWLRDAMVAAINKGLPIFVSEYGICDASGNGNIDEYQAGEWMDLLNRYGISRMAWNLSNKPETSSMISSGCLKTSGWSYDDLSASGKWFFDMLGADATVVPYENVISQPEQTNTAGTSDEASLNQNTQQGNAEKSGIYLENAPYELKSASSWEANGTTFHQYELIVKNDTQENASDWSVTITFPENMVVTDSWNGNFTYSGNQVIVRAKDHNGFIPAGDSVGNIGFIAHN